MAERGEVDDRLLVAANICSDMRDAQSVPEPRSQSVPREFQAPPQKNCVQFGTGLEPGD
jgi:hypothetical protein